MLSSYCSGPATSICARTTRARLSWDCATTTAIEYAPRGEIVAQVLAMMRDAGNDEQDVA
jgi:hypothetical protein